MRIALCLSGQMRTYKSCYSSLMKNLINPLNPDIFIDTWSNSGISTYLNRRYNINKKYSIVKENEIKIEELKSLYKTNHIHIEKFKSRYVNELNGISVPEEVKKIGPRQYQGNLPMFYKMYKCNKMKCEYEEKYNFKYDLVIRMRPDIQLKDKLPIKFFIKNKNIFFRPSANHGKLPAKFCTDQFGIGNSEVMDYYSNIFKNLTEYWKNPFGDKDELIKLGFTENEINEYPSNLNICYRLGERLMTYHMYKSNYKILDYSTNFKLIRPKSQSFQEFLALVKMKIKSK